MKKTKWLVRYLVKGKWVSKAPKDLSEIEGIEESAKMSNEDWKKLEKLIKPKN